MLKGKRTGFLLLILLFSVCCHCPSQASIQQDSVTYNGHSYAVLAGYGAPTFYQAYEDCKNAGGHLVTISSAREEKVVRNLAKNGGANWYWIGLAKTGNTWSWVDGSKVKYTYWANNAPATKKNYAFMYGKSYRDSKKVKKAVGRWDSMSAYDPLFTSEEFYNENNGRILCEWDYVAGEAEPAITYP